MCDMVCVVLTREEGQEALSTGVDDVYLMEGHGMDHLLPLLELSLRALHEPAGVGSAVGTASYIQGVWSAVGMASYM